MLTAASPFRRRDERAELREELAALGIQPGEVLLVQAAVRHLDPLEGGAATVVDALLDALNAPHGGTLVAYTATPENSATSREALAATRGLSPEQIEDFRARMPPFDPATTPSSATMGVLSEIIRTRPGAVRSSHPQTSFAAIGRQARFITDDHPLECHLGERSALGRLYELDARVLLIGVPMARFTAFHLADLRMPDVTLREYRCRVGEGWIAFRAPDLNDGHFAALGRKVLERVTGAAKGRVGGADCLLVPVREAVDRAEQVLLEQRGRGPVG
ncbi:AAC(3) family N-acetyltransferase [Kitasatospora sp. NPDC047058]|uniref:aminoglycoside N(3)-acetyltransferase n=1 Tax=Kitasatospora sp. NPDC047058 TaxID=3155620 RepID=UPI0034026EE7